MYGKRNRKLSVRIEERKMFIIYYLRTLNLVCFCRFTPVALTLAVHADTVTSL